MKTYQVKANEEAEMNTCNKCGKLMAWLQCECGGCATGGVDTGDNLLKAARRVRDVLSAAARDNTIPSQSRRNLKS